MLRTVVSGIVSLAIALLFFGVVLLKIQEPVLWIVVGIGVAMMIWNIVDGVRDAKLVHDTQDTLPTGQQERHGVS
ncbi:MAG: hypothetical protein R3349_04815 [Geminicoccaceae bacterium]|nr:hypothetical protein [Geminicoccaceae bacterium]